MTKFTDLGLDAKLLKALDAEDYTTPTPIQAKAIPAVLTGTDLLGIAQTGTGKTAAFALPILHRLNADPRPAPQGGCRVLVLSPTRELASQIADSFRTYGRNMRLSVTTVFGGVGHRPQIRALSRGVDILIATPGRLLDHMQSGNANLAKTEILVLDEADQMLDLGFVKPIRTIVAAISGERQTLFFSATMPREISKLANEFLDDPVKVTVTPVSSTVELISQKIIFIEAAKKRALLGELLAKPDMSRTLVFTRTKRGADRVAKHLDARDIAVAAIHGNKSQSQREKALNAFRKDKIQVLVATDIAARGIDVDAVSHVVNYELPEVPEAYVHRIGRTARAGASGSAISLCDGAERHLLRAIERLTKQSIPSEDRRRDTELEVEKKEPRKRGGSRGANASRGGERNARGGDRNRSDSRQNAGRGPGRGGKPGRSRNSERTGGNDRQGGNRQASGARRNSGGFDPLHARFEQMSGEEANAGGTEGNRRSRRRAEPRNADAQAKGGGRSGRSGGKDRERDRSERDTDTRSGPRNKRTGSKARKNNSSRGDGRSGGGRKEATPGGNTRGNHTGNGGKPNRNRNKNRSANRSDKRLENA